MNTKAGRIIQVASSFTCKPIERSLGTAILNAGIGDGVGFSQYEQMSQYMLGTAPDSMQILGTIVLLRVEDWLREDLKSATPLGAPATPSQPLHQQLRSRANDFLTQITTLARRGKPVWFLACPSKGWVAERHKIGTLCQTHANLIVARLQNDSQITPLRWPTSSFTGEVQDNRADRLGQIPFTQPTFDRLGEFLGAQIARTIERNETCAAPPVHVKSPELADYLASLKVHVQLAPADSDDRPKLDRILRMAADFTLKGEQRELSEDEMDALMDSGGCMRIVVSDRLSNYGISGILAYRSTPEALIVEVLSLSCTVLGKQAEFAVLSALRQIAADLHVAKLVFAYAPAERNHPMLTFLQSVADEESGARFVVPVAVAEERIRAAAVIAGAWTVELERSVAGSTAR